MPGAIHEHTPRRVATLAEGARRIMPRFSKLTATRRIGFPTLPKHYQNTLDSRFKCDTEVGGECLDRGHVAET